MKPRFDILRITLKRAENKGWECKLTPLPNKRARRVPIVPRPITAGTKKRKIVSWPDAIRLPDVDPDDPPPLNSSVILELVRLESPCNTNIEETGCPDAIRLPDVAPDDLPPLTRSLNHALLSPIAEVYPRDLFNEPSSDAADAAAVRVDTPPPYEIPKTCAALKDEERLLSVMRAVVRTVRVDILRIRLKQAENKDWECKLPPFSKSPQLKRARRVPLVPRFTTAGTKKLKRNQIEEMSCPDAIRLPDVVPDDSPPLNSSVLVRMESPCNTPVALDDPLTLGTNKTPCVTRLESTCSSTG